VTTGGGRMDGGGEQVVRPPRRNGFPAPAASTGPRS
jgi:hypothetical protein